MVLTYRTLNCSPKDTRTMVYLLCTLASIPTSASPSPLPNSPSSTHDLSLHKRAEFNFRHRVVRMSTPTSLPALSPSAPPASSFPHPLPHSLTTTVTNLHPSAPISDDRECIQICLCLGIPGKREEMITYPNLARSPDSTTRRLLSPDMSVLGLRREDVTLLYRRLSRRCGG